MALDAPNARGHCSDAVWERPQGGRGTVLDVSWPLLARLGRLKIGLWAPFGRPRAVPSASGRVPERPWAPKTARDRFFHRFLVDLAWIFIDFRPSFRSMFGRFGRCVFCFCPCFPVFLCFVDLHSLVGRDDALKVKRRKNVQVSRPSCAWPLELVHATFTILSATCEPMLYTFDQATST